MIRLSMLNLFRIEISSADTDAELLRSLRREIGAPSRPAIPGGARNGNSSYNNYSSSSNAGNGGGDGNATGTGGGVSGGYGGGGGASRRSVGINDLSSMGLTRGEPCSSAITCIYPVYGVCLQRTNSSSFVRIAAAGWLHMSIMATE